MLLIFSLLIIKARAFDPGIIELQVWNNVDGTINASHDCLLYTNKDYTAAIWSSDFPNNINSLTIENCEHLVLNISRGSPEKRNFNFLTIRNVKYCNIIIEDENEAESVEGSSWTELPCRSTFVNVKSLTMDGPLYRGDSNGIPTFADGVLQFINVTIENLPPKAVALDSASFSKFSMLGVSVLSTSKNAIVFSGGSDSVLEIENSFFLTMTESFFVCNVTRAMFSSNWFHSLKRGSLSLNTESFYFEGNTVLEVESNAFNVSSCTAHIRENVFNFSKTDLFNSVTRSECSESSFNISQNEVKKTAEIPIHMEIMSLKLEMSPSNECSESSATDCGFNGDQVVFEGDAEEQWNAQHVEQKDVSSFLTRMGNNFLLLWFLAVSFLILMFPTAYFVKIYFCKVVDQAFPMEARHKQLVNEEDDT